MAIENTNDIWSSDGIPISDMSPIEPMDGWDLALEEGALRDTFFAPEDLEELYKFITENMEEGEIMTDDQIMAARSMSVGTQTPVDVIGWAEELEGMSEETFNILYCVTGYDLRRAPHFWRRGHHNNRAYEFAFISQYGALNGCEDPYVYIPRMKYVLECFFREIVNAKDTMGIVLGDANWDKGFKSSDCVKSLIPIFMSNFDKICNNMVWTGRVYARVNQLADLCIYPHRQHHITTYMFEENAERQMYWDFAPGSKSYHMYWRAVLYATVNFMSQTLKEHPCDPEVFVFSRAGY